MNDVNNINGNVQPTTPIAPTPNVNEMPTGQINTTVQPMPTQETVAPTVQPTPAAENQAPIPQATGNVSQVSATQAPTQANETVDPMSAVANLNKDEAMEEALSHTTQYSPFEAPKQEVNQEVKKTNNKSAYIFIGIIFAIMLLFIIFLPQISNLFGWV